ncbi:hypothetical protein ACTFIR_006418 [Dictyostelium discoideum]
MSNQQQQQQHHNQQQQQQHVVKPFLNSFDGSIKLEESIEDSPQFRKHLKDTEQSIDELTQNIKKMLKSSKQSCELGDDYNITFKNFVDDLLTYKGEAGSGFVRDELLEKSMIKFSTALKEICNFRELLHIEMDALITGPLQSFAENDLRQVKEQCKKYDKYSQQYDASASKLGQIKKKNSVRIEEVSQEANETLKLRVQFGLDLVESMNQVQARRRFEFLEYFSVYLHAQSTFFHQGYELFRDLEPHMRVFSDYLQATRKHFEDEKRKQTMLKAELIEKTFLNSPSSNTSMSGSPVNGGIIFTTNRTSQDTLFKKGYLFKRSEYNSYTRKFFELSNGKLSYYKTGNDTSPSHTHDLFLTTVRIREDLDRRYCFELLSPDRSIILAAETFESMQEWVQVLQNTIANLLNNCSPQGNLIVNNLSSPNSNCNNNNNNNSNNLIINNSNNNNNNFNNNNISLSNSPSGNNIIVNSFNNNNNNNNGKNIPFSDNHNGLNSSCGSTTSSSSIASISVNNSGNNINIQQQQSQQQQQQQQNETPISILRRIDSSNLYCADCNTRDPDWASINFGCLLCIDCSGIHRGMGVHISKVRSVILDKWEPELLNMMKCIGNEKVNRIYENKIPPGRKKPTPNDEFEIRAKWIRDKYDKRLFVNFLDKSLDDINSLFYHIASEPNASYILELIAQGADPNYKEPHHDYKSPLHNAAQHNLPQNICLLLQNGAMVDQLDSNGNTPLHTSADCGSPDSCILLLMKSVKLLSITNKDNHTPLDLAVEKGHVGCVTILRLAQLQKDEGKHSFDDAFAELLRGFVINCK